MTKLINSSINQVFQIRKSDWNTIDQRVSFILKIVDQNENFLNDAPASWGGLLKIPWSRNNTYINPGQMSSGTIISNFPSNPQFENVINLCLSQPEVPHWIDTQLCVTITYYDVGGTPSCILLWPKHSMNIVSCCQNWSKTIHPSMKSLAKRIASYSQKAISEFKNVQDQLNGNSNNLSPAIQSSVKTAIDNLAVATSSLASDAKSVMSDFDVFVQANNTFFHYFQSNSFLVPLLNCPMLSASSIKNLDNALGAVNGSWSSLNGDISSLSQTCQNLTNVTKSFIESLEIGTALSLWESVKNDAESFVNA